MKNVSIMRNVVAAIALMAATTAMADVTFGFKRVLTENTDGSSTGTCGDVVLENGHQAISLTWIEKHNSSIKLATGQKTFTLDEVAYTTTGSEMDIQFSMGGTFELEVDNNYFGYEMTLAEGYTLSLNHVLVDYWRTNKGLGYEVDVIDQASTADTIKLGSKEERKVMNVQLDADVSDCVLQDGHTYHIIVRHRQWYSGGWAEHYPLTFYLTGSLTSANVITPELQSLTVGGEDILPTVKNGEADYTMTYGISEFPQVAATVNDGCRVTVEQPTLKTMRALVVTFDNNDNAVDSIYINMYAGIPAQPSDYVTLAIPTITIEDGDDADQVTMEAEGLARIYYTLTGDDPRSATAREYSEPFPVAGNCTLKAYATLNEFNLQASDVAEATISNFSKDVDPDHPESFQMPAFPGAEGGGRYVTGGRGGKVYHVTSLEDDGSEGTLRYAIGQSGARTIVFDVAGIIELKSDLVVYNGDLTIAGQTAPGDGICLKNYALHFRCNNVICRYIRSRLGHESGAETDAAWARDQNNIILDHCSFSWSVDETASFYNMTNFTMQWCYVNESMAASTHVKGAHGYGGLWGGWNASYHHNMIANHLSRTPRWVVFPNGSVDFRNNVTYNWGPVLGCYGAAGGKYNILNNFYKPGAATNEKPQIAGRIVSCGVVDEESMEVGQFYLTGNRFDYSSPYLGSTAYNNAKATDKDNTKGLHRDTRVALKEYLSDHEHYFPYTTTHTAEVAREKVLQYGGCCLRRDAIDERVANDVTTGKYTYADGATKGSNGSTGGLIDAPEDVGGYVEYTCTNAEKSRKRDSDSDGIPDQWEEVMGLDPEDPSDAQQTSPTGYSWLENYLASLVTSITKQCSNEGTTTGIESVKADKTDNADWEITAEGAHLKGAAAIRAYDTAGNCRDYQPCDILSFSRLAPGVYILAADMADGTAVSRKVAVR